MKPGAQLSGPAPEKISCPMCGHRFNPAEHLACQACPLQKGCQLVCCPNCGYETVDVNGSKLASWVAGWFRRDKTANHEVH